MSKRDFEVIYKTLNISFGSSDIPGTGYCGESFYQDKIESTITSLGKLVEKRGEALLLFTGLAEAKQEPTEEHPDGEIPLFVRKSDGGVGYDSTDLAAVKFRIEQLKVDRVLYVTDAGQQTHFHMIFEAAKKAGWAKHTQLDHVKFGLVLAKGSGKFKTRDGDVVKLSYLLECARDKMKEVLVDRMNKGDSTTTIQLTEDQIESHAVTIGTAAIKYFDLRNNRIKNYEFDIDLMCSDEGDTAVYLMYAYARIGSIIDKGDVSGAPVADGYQSEGSSEKERSLALLLIRFHEIFNDALSTLSPHHICGYLYSLSSELSAFTQDNNERIWQRKAADSSDPWKLEPDRGVQRWILLKAAKLVLFECFGLLGIVPLDRM